MNLIRLVLNMNLFVVLNEGMAVGVIRCSSMGTKYQLTNNNKILFLKVYGDCAKMATFLSQYKQVGALIILKV